MRFEPKAGVYYHLVAKHSGKCLQVDKAKTPKASIVQYAELTPATNQQFGLVDAGDGYFYIVARHSGSVLNVSNESKDSGAIIEQWKLRKTDNQKFKFEPTQDGYYYIRNKHSNLCLDIYGGLTDDGARLQQYAQGIGSANQQFRLEPLGDGYYRITARHSGKCLDVFGGDTADGTIVQQWQKGPANDHQLFTFATAGDGYYRITARHSGKCLEVAGRSMFSQRVSTSANGALITQSDVDTNNSHQLFKLETTEDGYCRLIAKESEKCVSVVGPIMGKSTDDGALILQWEKTFDGNQEFWPVSDETRAAQQFISVIAASDFAKKSPEELEKLAQTTKPEDAAKWAADNLGLIFSGAELESVSMKLKSLTEYVQSYVPSKTDAGGSSSPSTSSRAGTAMAYAQSEEFQKNRKTYEQLVTNAAKMVGTSSAIGSLFKLSCIFTYSLLRSGGGGDSEARSTMQTALGSMLGTSDISDLAKDANLTGSKILDQVFYTSADVLVGVARGFANAAQTAVDKVVGFLGKIFSGW